MDDSDDALRKFGLQVLQLVRLYHKAAQTGDRAKVQEFHVHLHLVEALAQVAVLKLIRCPDPEELK